MSALTRHHIATPIGPLTIELSDDALTLLEFGALGKATPGTATKGLAGEIARQIEAYFAGKLKQFDLPLHAEGTPFRQKVWQALRDVPYGQTRSYGEIARAVDSAPRAVGATAQMRGRFRQWRRLRCQSHRHRCAVPPHRRRRRLDRRLLGRRRLRDKTFTART